MYATHNVQIRNVSEPVHRALKARAALAGMSLSDYLRVELERIVATPTLEEFQRRLASQPPAILPGGAERWLYDVREERLQVAEPPPPPYEPKR